MKDAYCDSEPYAFVSHMCYMPPDPELTCDHDCHDSPTRKGECEDLYHLCFDNIDYRHLMNKVCPRTCGHCGMLDLGKKYNCPQYAEFCFKDDIKEDCRLTCFEMEYMVKGQKLTP